MDCCKPGNKLEKGSIKELKGGETKMDAKKIILWIIIAALILAVIYVLFFRGSGSGQVVSSAGQAAKSVASSGMVGGC